MARSNVVPNPARRVVLFIDRDSELRSVYTEISRLMAVASVVASTIEEGCAFARMVKPDLIAVEAPLPPWSFDEIAPRLRSCTPDGAWLLGLTTLRRKTYPALAGGEFDALLWKPFGLADLEAEMERGFLRVSARRGSAVVAVRGEAADRARSEVTLAGIDIGGRFTPRRRGPP